MREWAREHPEVEFTELDPAGLMRLPWPARPSSDPPSWFRILQTQSQFATWRAHIPGGRVFGADATVIGQDDTVFGELHNYWPKTYEHQDVLRRLRLPRPRRVTGRVAVLAARHADSYYHWLVDIIPRVRLLGDELHTAERIVVPSALPFQRECLKAAGVPLDRLVEPAKRLHLVADELLVPSLVPRLSEPVIPYLQSIFAREQLRERAFRRLYVTRVDARRRRVANEAELAGALARLGFETVQPGRLSVAAQARLFSEAAIVVGPNGGGLTNIVFSQPGVQLVELFDSNYVISGFWELANRVGGEYHLLITPSPPTRSQWRDITVPVDQLVRMLGACGID